MDLLRERLAARSAARLLGGGGGGGGGGAGGDVGIGSEADPGVGGAPPGSPSGAAAVGGTNSGGAPGIGLGVTNASTIGLGLAGLAMGLPTGMMNATATLGNAINGVTGFGGGTPSADTSAPGGAMFTGWGGPTTFGGGEQPLDYDPRIANIMGIDYARRVFQPQPALPGFGVPGLPAPGAAPAAPAAAPSAPAPGPAPTGSSPEADALRAAQLDLVNQQRSIASEMLRRQNLLEGTLLGSQGLEQVLGPNGEVTGYRQTADAQARQAQADQINNLLRTRTLAALNGELPVDPALERQITENRNTLEAQLRGNLGSGFATSTPGIQALADFEKRAEELREGMRRDTLTTSEGIRLAGEDLGNRISSNRFGNVVGLSQLPSSAAGVFSQAGSGLTPSLQNLLGFSQIGSQRDVGMAGLDTSRWLGQLDADTRRAIAQMQGAFGAQSDQARVRAADNAGTGQLFGTLGAALISNPDSLSTILGGLSDFGGSLIDSIGGLF